MTVADPMDYAPAPPVEPFGQAGVRQFAGRIVAWAMLTVGLSAAAMAYRSGGYVDALEWKGQGQSMRIISGNGQIALIGVTSARIGNGDTGWSYRGGYGGRRWGANRGPWKTSVGETVGIEGRLSPPSPEYTGGFWLRLKWPTVAALFMLQPLVYVLIRIVRLRRRRVAA